MRITNKYVSEEFSEEEGQLCHYALETTAFAEPENRERLLALAQKLSLVLYPADPTDLLDDGNINLN